MSLKGQQADYEFNCVDGTLWAEQVAWEERQARSTAFIDSTLDAEATAWQRKGMDELTPFEVELLRAQEQQDAFNAAAPDPDREGGTTLCVWGSGDCDPFSLKVMRPTAEESKERSRRGSSSAAPTTRCRRSSLSLKRGSEMPPTDLR